jgi:hypothetical protein
MQNGSVCAWCIFCHHQTPYHNNVSFKHSIDLAKKWLAVNCARSKTIHFFFCVSIWQDYGILRRYIIFSKSQFKRDLVLRFSINIQNSKYIHSLLHNGNRIKWTKEHNKIGSSRLKFKMVFLIKQ